MNGDEIQYGPQRKLWRETLSPIATSADGKLLVSPPSVDPLRVYDFKQEPLFTSSKYQVPSVALSETQRTEALVETTKVVEATLRDMLGYQSNCRELSHVEWVKSFQATRLNNHGSPFVATCSGLTTHCMERNVLDYFASLWHAKWPHNPRDPESYWGYVLTMGSTEGNLYAVWNARNYLSGKYMSSATEKSKCSLSNYNYKQCKCPDDNPNALSPVAFYSHETHYSIAQALEAMAVSSFYEIGTKTYPEQCPLGTEWPLAVPCEGGDAGNGTVDIKALSTLVDFFSAKGHPIIVILNYGTTFKGAYDDVKSAGEALMPILKKNNMYEQTLHLGDPKSNTVTRKGFWFHIDGALGAAYAPFLQMAYENDVTKFKPPPVFDFRLDFVSSIVTSGHKWIGSPWPCGIYISKTEYQLCSPESASITYIDSADTALSGSRNGHSVLILWSYISMHDYEEQAKVAVSALDTAAYSVQKLKELELGLKQDLRVMYSPASMAVCFKRPNERITRKYSLSGHWLHIKGEWCQYVHIYITNGVTKAKIDELLEDLRTPDAFANF